MNNNKVLLYNTGNHIHYPILTMMGKNFFLNVGGAGGGGKNIPTSIENFSCTPPPRS